MQPKQASRNNLIDMVRLACAILVVSAHAMVFNEFNESLSYTFRQTLPRFTVLFFFSVAGYFYTGSLMAGKKPMKRYCLRLFIPYLFWSACYVIPNWFYQGKPALNGAFFGGQARDFLLVGNWFHLWFFPSMFLCVFLTTLFWNLGKKKGLNLLLGLSFVIFLVGCLGCSYYNIGARLPLVGRLIQNSDLFEPIRKEVCTGVPFFLLGYLLRVWQPKWREWNNRGLVVALLLFGALYGAEYLGVTLLHLKANGFLLPTMYPLMLVFLIFVLRHPLPGREKAGRMCLVMANFTYYAHDLFRYPLFAYNEAHGFPSETWQFLIVVALTLLAGYGLYRLDNPRLNKLVL